MLKKEEKVQQEPQFRNNILEWEKLQYFVFRNFEEHLLMEPEMQETKLLHSWTKKLLQRCWKTGVPPNT